MEIQIESVTPDKATRWLNLNKSNRKMRTGVSEKYADDMRNGRWTSCPEPIAFYVDGDLADGQHRLWAIVDSGMTIRFPIARGLQREDGLNLNTGLGRTLVDNGRISGVDPDLSPALVSTARSVAVGEAAKGSLSNARKLEYIDTHREAAQWAVTNVKRTKFLCSAPIQAAIARAWYVETDHARLKRFCDVLGTGFSNGEEESAAIALRNYILQRMSSAASAAMWRDTFLKTQNAVRYFMQAKKLTIIKSVAEEIYPLKKTRKARIASVA